MIKRIFAIIIVLLPIVCIAATHTVGGLADPSSIGGVANADIATIGGVTFTQAGGEACEETATGPQQTVQDGGRVFSTTQYQKLKITSTISVCKADVFFGTGQTGTCKLQFWTDNAKAGSQVGSDSNTVTCAGWPTAFTFATPVELTDDVFLHIVAVSGTQNAMGIATDVASYEDTNYDFGEDGTDLNDDLTFKLYLYY